MKIAIICIASLALLQFLLAVNCSLNRRKGKVSHGSSDDPDDPMYRAVVAHRNASEYTPLFCLLILFPQWTLGAPAWSVYLAPLVVIARVLHAYSLVSFSLKRSNKMRVLAAFATYILGLTYAGLLFYLAATT